ncbi:unnamed protein product [Protopolystoma xenopodis]|uniref:Uncharacterized protein n=1 Tax=Protopolystoma xenopodis TaxID=117903 RepID=A0A448X397_9PLAT|nr:unnamed protein product [Protopolystoma xenopodis]
MASLLRYRPPCLAHFFYLPSTLPLPLPLPRPPTIIHTISTKCTKHFFSDPLTRLSRSSANSPQRLMPEQVASRCDGGAASTSHRPDGRPLAEALLYPPGATVATAATFAVAATKSSVAIFLYTVHPSLLCDM